MEQWREWVEASPVWRIAVLLGASFGLLQFVIPGGPASGTPSAAIVQGLLFGVGMGALFWWRRRRDVAAVGTTSEAARAERERVLRTGVLPDDVRHDGDIGTLLQRRRRQQNLERRLGLWFFLALAALSLVTALATGDAWSLAFGVALVLLGAWSHRSAVTTLRRYDRVEAALAQRGRGEPMSAP